MSITNAYSNGITEVPAATNFLKDLFNSTEEGAENKNYNNVVNIGTL